MADEKSLTGMDDTFKKLTSVWGGQPPAAAPEPPTAPTPPPDEDRVKARGIGLKSSEWAAVDEIAAHLGMTPHSLAAHALRDWLKRWAAGEIETTTAPRLK